MWVAPATYASQAYAGIRIEVDWGTGNRLVTSSSLRFTISYLLFATKIPTRDRLHTLQRRTAVAPMTCAGCQVTLGNGQPLSTRQLGDVLTSATPSRLAPTFAIASFRKGRGQCVRVHRPLCLGNANRSVKTPPVTVKFVSLFSRLHDVDLGWIGKLMTPVIVVDVYLPLTTSSILPLDTQLG